MTDLPASHWLLGEARAFAAQSHRFPWLVAQRGGGLGSFRALHRRIWADLRSRRRASCACHRSRHMGPRAAGRQFPVIVGDSLLTSEGPLWKTRHDAVRPLLARSSMRRGYPRCSAGPPSGSTTGGASARRRAAVAGSRNTASRHGESGRAVALHGPRARVRRALWSRHSRWRCCCASATPPTFVLPYWVPTGRHRRLNACRQDIDGFVGRLCGCAAGGAGGSDILAGLMAARSDAGALLDRTALINEAKPCSSPASRRRRRR